VLDDLHGRTKSKPNAQGSANEERSKSTAMNGCFPWYTAESLSPQRCRRGKDPRAHPFARTTTQVDQASTGRDITGNDTGGNSCKPEGVESVA